METFEVLDKTIILDGCHNGDSMQLFLEVRKLYPWAPPAGTLRWWYREVHRRYAAQVYTHADSVIYLQSGHFKAVKELAVRWHRLDMT